ncbi:MAG: polysaccharide biosynthesis/export family protein [Limisphaerales bacterium]
MEIIRAGIIYFWAFYRNVYSYRLRNNGPVNGAEGDSPLNASAVAHFQIGDTVIVTLSGPPDPIVPHEEPIKEDGTITMPYIGSVQALGKTSGQLQKDIHDLYVPKYYNQLTVTVKSSQDRVYYVGGEVKQPGRQLYVGATTVTKAIQSVGDFTDFASHTVYLIRANGQRIKINCDKALKNPSLDLPVYPGDQIQVPRRLF